MAQTRPIKLYRPVDAHRDHILRSPAADMTLVEYGSYTCSHCLDVLQRPMVEGMRANTNGRM